MQTMDVHQAIRLPISYTETLFATRRGVFATWRPLLVARRPLFATRSFREKLPFEECKNATFRVISRKVAFLPPLGVISRIIRKKVHANSIKVSVDIWYAGRDSNPQPSEPESDALSIEPLARITRLL